MRNTFVYVGNSPQVILLEATMSDGYRLLSSRTGSSPRHRPPADSCLWVIATHLVHSAFSGASDNV